ncbi:Tuberous sclerosis 2-like protein [Xylographa trunciseda]|nr:Tuberous sclerosis 2-like protein [Xylographa trunciseda]
MPPWIIGLTTGDRGYTPEPFTKVEEFSISAYMNQSEVADDSTALVDAAGSPSLQERIRSINFAQGSPSETPPTSRHGKQREIDLKVVRHALDLLKSTQSLQNRKTGAEYVGSNINAFSPDALGAVWVAADDAFKQDASLSLRYLGFSLIDTSLLHTGLGLAERMKLFRMIIVPIEPSGMDKQIQALTAITNRGRDLEPFGRSLVVYLSAQLGPVHKASVEARKKLKSDRADGPTKVCSAAIRKALSGLFSLIEDVLRAHPDAIDGHELNVIVQDTLKILQMTSSERDMKGALSIIKAVTAVSHIPEESLKLCVEVLGAISVGINELRDMALGCLQNLLESRDQSNILTLLTDTAFSSTQGPESMNVKGAIAMIVYFVRVDEDGRLCRILVTQLYDTFFDVTKSSATAEYWRNWLCLFSELLAVPSFREHLLLRDEWTTVVKRTIGAINNDTEEIQGERTLPISHTFNPTSFPSPYQSKTPDLSNLLPTTKQDVNRIIDALSNVWPRMTKEAQWRLFQLFYYSRDILSVQSQRLLVSCIVELGMLSPNDGDWDDCLSQLVKFFILGPKADITIRLLIVTSIKESISQLTSEDYRARFRAVVIPLLDNMKWHEEDDLHFINNIADFAASYALIAELSDFEHLLQLLYLMSSVVSKVHVDSPRLYEHEDEAARNMVSVALVRLFLQCLTTSAIRTSLVYAALIEVVRSHEFAPCIRLPALRLLTRLRCDIYHAIYLTPNADSLNLAAAVARTEASKVRLSVFHNPGDRSTLYDDQSGSRVGRSSTISHSGLTGSRASTQSTGRQDAETRAQPPQWSYPGLPGLPQDPPESPSLLVNQHTPGAPKDKTLRLSEWLAEVIGMLQTPDDWEIYSYVLVHLPSQLSNPTLFSTAAPHIHLLGNVIVSQLMGGTFRTPPINTGVKRGDVAFCLYNILVMLLGYYERFSLGEQDDMVRIILDGISSWDRVAKVCIQGLGICCHVIPKSVAKSLGPILQKMSQIITQSHLSMDILEFLAGLARLPDVYATLSEDELRTVFAICVRYLEHSRDHRTKLRAGIATDSAHAFNRSSGISGDSVAPSEASNVFEVQKDLPQYIFALAYHVLTIWFLSIRLEDRPKHVGWITRNLASRDDQGNDVLEEQSQVTLDMMHRTAYLDLGETKPCKGFSSSDGRVFKKSWLLGLSIVTVETASGNGITHLVKRQASGTTYAIYLQNTAPLPPHHARGPMDVNSSLQGAQSRINVFPNHVFLQLTSTIAPTPSPTEAICLPDDEATRRAIAAFDRNDTVDGYKVGVIYVGTHQTEEAEILANSSHTEAFQQLLEGLGTKVELKGAIFNTQGLDKEYDTDGIHTYAWRDRITEIVFHVPSMMPTNKKSDPTCVKKKSHIGNDFVNIIFNDSGSPFKFDTFPSQFNYINIIITPESPLAQKNSGIVPPSVERNPYPQKQLSFTIQTQSHPSFPNLSPAASYKLLSLKHVASLARQIALNASVFSNVWANREGGEHVSSWRNRLREIKKLRARFANSGTSASDRYPGAKASKTYVEGDPFTGLVVMGGLAEDDGILSGLDFSRWAGPNPSLT